MYCTNDEAGASMTLYFKQLAFLGHIRDGRI